MTGGVALNAVVTGACVATTAGAGVAWVTPVAAVWDDPVSALPAVLAALPVEAAADPVDPPEVAVVPVELVELLELVADAVVPVEELPDVVPVPPVEDVPDDPVPAELVAEEDVLLAVPVLLAAAVSDCFSEDCFWSLVSVLCLVSAVCVLACSVASVAGFSEPCFSAVCFSVLCLSVLCLSVLCLSADCLSDVCLSEFCFSEDCSFSLLFCCDSSFCCFCSVFATGTPAAAFKINAGVGTNFIAPLGATCTVCPGMVTSVRIAPLKSTAVTV